MKSRLVLISVLLLAVLVLVAAPVSAHEHREVGDYEFTFGWRVEPAFVGVFSGPEFRVADADEAPVEGLEDTLQMMVHFGDQSKMLEIRGVFRDPGHYTADLIPTRPGDYAFHVFGMIGDLEVDEMFTSADGGFSSIEPATDIMFPAPDSDLALLQTQIDDLRAQLEAMMDS